MPTAVARSPAWSLCTEEARKTVTDSGHFFLSTRQCQTSPALFVSRVHQYMLRPEAATHDVIHVALTYSNDVTSCVDVALVLKKMPTVITLCCVGGDLQTCDCCPQPYVKTFPFS